MPSSSDNTWIGVITIETYEATISVLFNLVELSIPVLLNKFAKFSAILHSVIFSINIFYIILSISMDLHRIFTFLSVVFFSCIGLLFMLCIF